MEPRELGNRGATIYRRPSDAGDDPVASGAGPAPGRRYGSARVQLGADLEQSCVCVSLARAANPGRTLSPQVCRRVDTGGQTFRLQSRPTGAPRRDHTWPEGEKMRLSSWNHPMPNHAMERTPKAFGAVCSTFDMTSKLTYRATLALVPVAHL